MMSRYEERQLLNKKHIEDPQPGDFWHEMFSPYHVVLAVADNHVIICEKTKPTDAHHYTFDLSETKTISHQEHRDLVTYQSMRDKFVADVVPNSKLMPMVKEWRDAKFKEIQSQLEYFR